MLGFETIGNATVICHDGSPVIATDPWLSGDAYFGSWGLSYEIPAEQRRHIAECRYIWLSHGHPDHLDLEGLEQLKGRTILLPDHVGGRIREDLSREGYTVRVLPDREWVRLSERIRVLCIADYSQNALLLVDVGGVLVVNMNDALDRGWGRFVRKIIRAYPRSFLLKLFCFGDTDMNNFFDETGRRVSSLRRFPLGRQVKYWAELYGARFVVPFSSFHEYQRTDSAWANEFTADWPLLGDGLETDRFELLPAFIRYDCECDIIAEIGPPKRAIGLRAPEEFGDSWSEQLEPDEAGAVEAYFTRFEDLGRHLDFVRIRVGGAEHVIPFRKQGFRSGVTFDVPRQSLVTAVRYEVFDDLLIGNFMRTTLHNLPVPEFRAQFAMGVAKVGDNGRARASQDIADYFKKYRRRSRIEYVLHALEKGSEGKVRKYLPRDGAAFAAAKRLYFSVKSRA